MLLCSGEEEKDSFREAEPADEEEGGEKEGSEAEKEPAEEVRLYMACCRASLVAM
jgi:hypothetical protein